MNALNNIIKAAQEAVVEGLSGLLGLNPLSQKNRLIRFQVAGTGPDTLLAERVTVLDGIGPNVPIPADFAMGTPGEAQTSSACGYRIELLALSEDAHLELKAFIGQPALLELLTDQSRTPRVWHGHVSAMRFMGSDGGLARYALVIECPVHTPDTPFHWPFGLIF